MAKIVDDLIQGLQEIIDYEQGKRKLRVDQICVVPLSAFSAEEIRNIRKMLGMSQSSFASVIGVTKKTVEAWEAGTNKPSGASARLLQLIKENPEIINSLWEPRHVS
ncbi:MAG: helix-turn-helix domain-containing protein [Eubacteriales bacterium]|nr:helix-turn-helix domain-containing protein [Eubacteriales bacterium]